MRMIRRKNQINQEDVLIKKFFDLYVLEPLNVFAGDSNISTNNYCRASKIKEELEKTVDWLFFHAKEALLTSIISEYKHKSYQYHGKLKKPNISLKDLDTNKLNIIYNVFNDYLSWAIFYGGRRWARATNHALQTPSTLNEKIIWLDRLFDMQHNCGNLLNKTDFSFLENKSSQYGKSLNKKYAIKLLNFRAVANLTQLSSFCSVKVKKLLIANKNHIPASLL